MGRFYSVIRCPSTGHWKQWIAHAILLRCYGHFCGLSQSPRKLFVIFLPDKVHFDEWKPWRRCSSTSSCGHFSSSPFDKSIKCGRMSVPSGLRWPHAFVLFFPLISSLKGAGGWGHMASLLQLEINKIRNGIKNWFKLLPTITNLFYLGMLNNG